MGVISKGLRNVRGKVDPHTRVIREAHLTKVHECTLWIHLGEGISCLSVRDAHD